MNEDPSVPPAAVCPNCGAEVETVKCRQVCPRCRVLVANCNGD